MAMIGGCTCKGIVGMCVRVSDGGLSAGRVVSADTVVRDSIVYSTGKGAVGTIVAINVCGLVEGFSS